MEAERWAAAEAFAAGSNTLARTRSRARPTTGRALYHRFFFFFFFVLPCVFNAGPNWNGGGKPGCVENM
jgi:hypothetical protein